MQALSRLAVAAALVVTAACADSHAPAVDYSGAWLEDGGDSLLSIDAAGRVGIYLALDEGSCVLIGRGEVEHDAIVALDGTRYPITLEGGALWVDDPADGLLTGRYEAVHYDDVCTLDPPPAGENGERTRALPIGPLEGSDGARGMRSVSISLPPGTLSFAIYVFGASVGRTVGPVALVAPHGEELLSREPDLAFCDWGFCAVLLPRNAAIDVSHGTYRLMMEGPVADVADLDARGVVRGGPRLPVTRVGVRPLVSSAALSDDELAAISARVTAFYAGGTALSIDLLPPVFVDAALGRIPADFAHPSVVELLSQGDADVVNVAFVDRIVGVSGLLGLSSGIPSALGLRGPWNGVLVSLDAHRVLGPPLDTEFVGDTTAHELGHALGLFHTTEERGLLHDPIADTPECLPEQDLNGDGSLTVDECEELDGFNFMFWTPVYGESSLAEQHETTEEQAFMLDHVVIGDVP